MDLELLACDIADRLSRNGYPIDVGESDILPELPDFIDRITRNAARED
jgi:hypothetical protein